MKAKKTTSITEMIAVRTDIAEKPGQHRPRVVPAERDQAARRGRRLRLRIGRRPGFRNRRTRGSPEGCDCSSGSDGRRLILPVATAAERLGHPTSLLRIDWGRGHAKHGGGGERRRGAWIARLHRLSAVPLPRLLRVRIRRALPRHGVFRRLVVVEAEEAAGLAAPERGVEAAAAEQLVVAADLDDLGHGRARPAGPSPRWSRDDARWRSRSCRSSAGRSSPGSPPRPPNRARSSPRRGRGSAHP